MLKKVDADGRATTLEVLMDPLDHQRLGDSDSEIVDRVIHLSELIRNPYAPSAVHLATWDTGMRFRAGAVGIQVITPPSDLEDSD
jgi:hypothetical protein